MAWPSTTQTGVTDGVIVSGVTTIRWGTQELVTNIAGGAVNGVTVGVVLRANQRELIDPIKLGQGAGLTSSRVLVKDGSTWDVTIRDDTAITSRPKGGTTVTIADMAGIFGTVGALKAATVVDFGYETAPKEAGAFNITIERLKLVEGT